MPHGDWGPHPVTTLDLVRAELAFAGCDGWCYAELIDRPGTGLGIGQDVPVVVASMYKLHLMVAACRAAAAGTLDLTQRVTITPNEHTPGPTGFALFADDVEVSIRDLVRMMITVSDNTAAEAVQRLLPAGALDETLLALSLEATVIRGGVRAQQQLTISELGARDWQDAAHLLATDPATDQVHAYDPAYVSHSTARALCQLMRAIWTNTASDPQQCAFMRQVLGQQIWPHRIASGFPLASTAVAGKTGTIGRIRAETAVVQPDGEPPVVVCVVTRAARADAALPTVDTAIGRIARLLVNEIRTGAQL